MVDSGDVVLQQLHLADGIVDSIGFGDFIRSSRTSSVGLDGFEHDWHHAEVHNLVIDTDSKGSVYGSRDEN